MKLVLRLAALVVPLLVLAACEGTETVDAVDFESENAALARASACAADFADGARVGAAADADVAPGVWSVSPYQVLIPASGVGYVNLHVDTPHYDWLVYTDQDVILDSLDGPVVEDGGPVRTCASLALHEYGAHVHETLDWPLRITGEPGARVHLFATLSATEHSDPSLAPHDHGDDGHQH